MIDLHSHILPAIDDGAATLQVSKEMLAASAALGFRTVAATPHLVGPLAPDYAASIREAGDRVEAEADSLRVKLVMGFEIRLTPDVPSRLIDGEPITLGTSRAVLVDLPFVNRPHFVDETLFAIQTAGFQPILAHPERYPDVQDDPTVAVELSQRGVALQLTIGSFSGVFGKRAKRTAEQLLRAGAVHLVATDAHSAGHRMAAVKPGLARLHDLVGPADLYRLTTVGPELLLNHGRLPEPITFTPSMTIAQHLRRVFAPVRDQN